MEEKGLEGVAGSASLARDIVMEGTVTSDLKEPRFSSDRGACSVEVTMERSLREIDVIEEAYDVGTWVIESRASDLAFPL